MSQPLPRMAIWLVPGRSQRDKLQKLIDALAKRYGAPTFVPHVTVYSCLRSQHQQELALVSKIAAKFQPVVMAAGNLSGSARLTRALFVELDLSPDAAAINAWLQRSVPLPSTYTFQPHLSLLYAHISDAERKKLSDEINLGMQQIVFDELWAVAIPRQLVSREDLLGWQLLLSCRLASATNPGNL